MTTAEDRPGPDHAGDKPGGRQHPHGGRGQAAVVALRVIDLSDAVVGRLSQVLQSIARLCVAVMMVLIMLDVGGRFLLNTPTQGAYIFNEAYLMPALVFFGMAGTYRADRHVQVTFVVDRLPRRVVALIQLLGLAACLVVVGALVYATWVDAIASWSRGDTTLGTIKWPLYIARTIPPIGFTALLLAMALDLVGRCRQLGDGDLTPDAGRAQ